jgi:ribonuclease T2
MRENAVMRTIAGVLAVLLLAGGAVAQKRNRSHAKSGDFDYYMLVLSYAPDFCAEPGGQKDPRECGAGRHVGFVVHGLWPQGEELRGPERCGSASPVAQSIVQATLAYIPTPGLIQHEWTNHGTCSGLGAADYFGTLRTARDKVKIPPELDQPGRQVQLAPADLEAKMAAANPQYPKEAFRTSCYQDNELQEIRICLNKDLSPRACGRSAGECRSGQVTMLPVR